VFCIFSHTGNRNISISAHLLSPVRIISIGRHRHHHIKSGGENPHLTIVSNVEKQLPSFRRSHRDHHRFKSYIYDNHF
jgi:hypothetical protein